MTITADSGTTTVSDAEVGRLYLITASTGIPSARQPEVYLAGKRDDEEFWYVIQPAGATGGWMLTASEVPPEVQVAYTDRRGWWIRASEVTGVLEEVPVPDLPVADQSEALAAEQRMTAAAQQEVRRIQQAFDDFKETVSSVGLEYAERHGWCSTYDEAMSRMGLPGRVRTFAVEVKTTITHVVHVRARDESEAEDNVNEAAMRTYVQVPDIWEDTVTRGEMQVYAPDGKVEVVVESVEAAE